MKKHYITSMALTASMVILLSACGTSKPAEDAEGKAKTEAAISETEKSEAVGQGTDQPGGTVKIMSGVTGGKDEEETKLFAQALSEATGLNVVIEKPASDYDKVLMQKLSGGEKYDLIYVSVSQYDKLVKQGALMDITDRVQASRILTGNVDPKEWEDITIDGRIYAGFNKKEVHRVVALNNTMLKEAGIDYKTIEPTMEGYYQVFKSLKDNSSDPDFYPFNTILSETWDLQPWMAAAGLKNGIVLDDAGKKYAPYAEDAAAPVWEWFKRLYDDGLMDPSAFVDKTKDMRAKMGAASLKTAVCADWVAWVGLHNINALSADISADEYEIVSLPGLKTPDGSYMLAKGGASLFAVPANSENPDGAVRVLEYFATQEGGDLLSSGIEGYDYTGIPGNYQLTETGKQHGSDHGAPFPIYKDFEPMFGYNPGIEEALGYGGYASVDMVIPNESDYKEIVGKWGIKMIKGELSSTDGLREMRKELVDRKVTDR